MPTAQGGAERGGGGQRSLLSFWSKLQESVDSSEAGMRRDRNDGEDAHPSRDDPGDRGQERDDGLAEVATVATERPLKAQRSVLQQKLEGAELKEEAKRKEVEQRFSWLEPGRVRDAHGRPESHPEHDPRTLQLPQNLKLSSSQQQYWQLKKRYRDVILFIRIGSFHELYGEDAEVGARELGWKLTVSGVGNCKQVGCPSSNVDAAAAALVAKGYKVAKIEQMETAKQAKDRVGRSSACIHRELVAAHSPGMLTEGALDGASLPNAAVHVLALCECDSQIGFAFLEAAAGRAFVGSLPDDEDKSSLIALLGQIEPSEALFPKDSISSGTKHCLRYYTSSLTALEPTTECPHPPHDRSAAMDYVSTTRFAPSADASSWPHAMRNAPAQTLSALCCLSSHLRRMISERELAGSAEVLPYEVHGGSLLLKGRTAMNLELAGFRGSVLSYLDRCCTGAGERTLKRWLMRPLRRAKQIEVRQGAVAELMQSDDLLQAIRASLGKCTDVERALGRLRSQRVHLPDGLPDDLLSKRRKKRHDAITAAEHASAAAADVFGNIVSYLSSTSHAKSEKLKEIAKAHLQAQNVAASAKAGRNLDDADDESVLSTIESILEDQASMRHVAEAVAELDALTSLALFGMDTGGRGPMCLPTVRSRVEGEPPMLTAKSLWNICITPDRQPVPNDIAIGGSDNARTLLLSGANMCGKSTIMRAVCVAAVLAHTGAPVPSDAMEVTELDAVFTRVGARDDVLSGESTFLVECNEASTMLREATEDSLVLVDELGRGTSTVDGYAIAYSALSQLSSPHGPRVLFSTHFHQLTEEFMRMDNVKQAHMACGEGSDGGLTFLYRLREGPCPRSYGLQVAQMAGVPKELVDRASIAAAESAQGQDSGLDECLLVRSFFHTLQQGSSTSQVSEVRTLWKRASMMRG